jgi:D-alanyl-D-alanine carboxypeptidase
VQRRTIAAMDHRTASARSPRNRIAAGAVAATLSALLLAATACSATDDVALDTTTVAAPASTTSTTSAPSTTSTTAPAVTTSTTAAPATDQRATRLHEILAAHHAGGDFVGARIALLDRDGTVTEAADGTTTVDPASGPVALDVPWNIGSLTKTFVAVVVLQLAAEGAIDLDAGIAPFLPDLPGADLITPRQLLQHTSGLGEYNDQAAVRSDGQREWTPTELIAVAEAAGRVGAPGGAFHYSNTNYIVLGEIIRQVTGHSWADEVRTRIVEPLGLTGTGAMTEQRPVGYTFVEGSFVDTTTSFSPSIGGAAGGMESTGRDLLQFATALRDGTLLDADSWAAMQAFVPGEDYSQFGIVHGYGLGLERYRTDAITVIGHMGTGEAQSAFVGFDPDHGTAVAVMTNTATPGPQAFMAVEALTAAATS